MGGGRNFFEDSSLDAVDGNTPPKPRKPKTSQYDKFFEESAERNGLDPDLLRAMTRQESSFNPNARSPKNAQGLMQLIPTTAKRFGVTDPYNPQQNIEGGAKYMRWLLDRYNGNVDFALAAYNAGEGRVDRYKGIPPYRETQNYVKAIRSRYKGNGYRALRNFFNDVNQPTPQQPQNFLETEVISQPTTEQAQVRNFFDNQPEVVNQPTEVDYKAQQERINSPNSIVQNPNPSGIITPTNPVPQQTPTEVIDQPQIQTLGGTTEDVKTPLTPPSVPVNVPQTFERSTVEAENPVKFNEPEIMANYRDYLKASGLQDSPEARKNYNQILVDSQNRANRLNQRSGKSVVGSRQNRTVQQPQVTQKGVTPNQPTPQNYQNDNIGELNLDWSRKPSNQTYTDFFKSEAVRQLTSRGIDARSAEQAVNDTVWTIGGTGAATESDFAEAVKNNRLGSVVLPKDLVARARANQANNKRQKQLQIAGVIARGTDLTQENYQELSDKYGISFEDIQKELFAPSSPETESAKQIRDEASKAYRSGDMRQYLTVLRANDLIDDAEFDRRMRENDEAEERLRKDIRNEVRAEPQTGFFKTSPIQLNLSARSPEETQQVFDQRIKEININYGGVANYYRQIDEEDRLNSLAWQKVRNNPNAVVTEFSKNLLRAVPKTVSAIFKSISIGAEALELGITGQGTKATEQDFYKAGQWIERQTDSWLPQDELLKRNFIATVLPDTFSQVAIQLGVGLLTGGLGAPVLLSATQGGSAAYDEALKGGAAQNQALGAFGVGALAASTDALPFGKYLKMLPTSGKLGFIGRFFEGFTDKAVKEFGEQTTRQIAARSAYNMFVNGGLGGGQEVGEDIINNWYASATYDPKRKVFVLDGQTIETFLAGFIGEGAAGTVIESSVERSQFTKRDQVDLANEYARRAEIAENQVKTAENQAVKTVEQMPKKQEVSSNVRRQQINQLTELGYLPKEIDGIEQNDVKVITENNIAPNVWNQLTQEAKQNLALQVVPKEETQAEISLPENAKEISATDQGKSETPEVRKAKTVDFDEQGQGVFKTQQKVEVPKEVQTVEEDVKPITNEKPKVSEPSAPVGKNENVSTTKADVAEKVEAPKEPKFAKNADGTLKPKNKYTSEEWRDYTKSVIDSKVAESAPKGEQPKREMKRGLSMKPKNAKVDAVKQPSNKQTVQSQGVIAESSKKNNSSSKDLYPNTLKQEPFSGSIPIIDEETFLTQNGASRQDIGDAALHKNKGRNSDKQWSKMVERQAIKDTALVNKREELRGVYQEKIAKGELRPPTRIEKLISQAISPMDELPSVQASRRLLEKKGVDWEKYRTQYATSKLAQNQESAQKKGEESTTSNKRNISNTQKEEVLSKEEKEFQVKLNKEVEQRLDAQKNQAQNVSNEQRTRKSRAILETRQPKGRTSQGKKTAIRIPDTNKRYEATYIIRELEDVVPSHNPFNFQPNEDYYFVNDRQYDKEKQYQEQVRNRSSSENFDAYQLINNSPTLETGSPVIDADGNVLGGNSRSMMLHRIYKDNGKAKENYLKLLKDEANVFGLNADEINNFKQPVLVREVNDNSIDKQTAITELNKTSTTALTATERAVSEANLMNDDAVDYVTKQIEKAGTDATLNDALNQNGIGIVNKLIEENVFTGGERNVLLDGNKISAEGKQRIEKLLLGRIFDDLEQLKFAPDYLKRNIQRIISPLIKTSADAEWNILPETREAIDLLTEYKAKGNDLSLADFANQVDMFRPQGWNKKAIQIADVLRQSPNSVSRAFKGYAREFQDAKDGTALFGAMTPKDAFERFFGNKKPLASIAQEAVNSAKKRLTESEQQLDSDSQILRSVPKDVVDKNEEIIQKELKFLNKQLGTLEYPHTEWSSEQVSQVGFAVDSILEAQGYDIDLTGGSQYNSVYYTVDGWLDEDNTESIEIRVSDHPSGRTNRNSPDHKLYLELETVKDNEDVESAVRKIITQIEDIFDKNKLFKSSDDAGQPMFKFRDEETFAELNRIFDELPFQDTEDIIANVETNIIDNGILQLNGEAQELIRRAMDVPSFDALFFDKQTARKLLRDLDAFIKESKENGYDSEDLKQVVDLRNKFKKLHLSPKWQGAVITELFENSRGEETLHRARFLTQKQDDLGNKYLKDEISDEAHQKIVNFDVFKDSLKNSRFGKDYKDFNEYQQRVEFIDKALDGQYDYLGLDTDEKIDQAAELITDWAFAFIEQNSDKDGNINLDFYKEVSKIAYRYLENARQEKQQLRSGTEIGKNKQTAQTSQNEQKPPSSQKQDSGDDGQGARGTQETGNASLKKSKTPETMRDSRIPLEDRYYEAVTNAGQKVFADELLDKGFDEAKAWFDANKGTQTGGLYTAVGATLMVEAGRRGDIDALNKIADDLVPALTDAGQAIQAVKIVSMFNPEMAGAYAGKVKKQRTGKDLTQKEYESAVNHARTVSDIIKSEELGKETQKRLEKDLAKAKEEYAELEEAYKLVSRSNDLHKTRLAAKAKEIRNLQAQVKRLKESRPKPARISALAKSLKQSADADIDILRSAFSDGVLPAIAAWHGSPYRFDKFSTEKIGTGEGNYNYVIFDDADVEIKEILASIANKPLTPETRSALIREAQRQIIAENPKNYKDLMKYLESITNGKVSRTELKEIHADAVNAIIDAPRTAKANERARIFTEHRREAELVTPSDKKLRRDFVKSLNKQAKERFKEYNEKLSPLADAITFIATTYKESNGELTPIHSPEAVWIAFNRESRADTNNIKADFNKEFPDATERDFRKALVEADKLFTDAKMLLNRNRLQAKSKTQLNETAIENLTKEQAQVRNEKAKAVRNANKFYSQLTKSTARNVVESALNFRRANLLSGFTIHLRNIFGNAIFQTSEETSRFLGALGDMAVSKFTGVRSFQGMSADALLKGFKSVIKQDEVLKNLNRQSGIKEAMNIMQFGVPTAELERMQLSESNIADFFDGKIMNTGGKVADGFINTIFRLLSAEDMIFKAFAFRRGIEELARLEAKNMGGTKADQQEYYKEFLKNPSELMQLQAAEYALEMTFQNDNVISDWLKEQKSKYLTVEAVTGIVAPFDRTPTNILIRMFDYSPVGLVKSGIALKRAVKGEASKQFSDKYRPVISEDVRKMSSLTPEQRANVIAETVQKAFTQSQQREFAKLFGRGTIGTAAIVIGYKFALAGLLTGMLDWDDEKKEKDEAMNRMKKGIDNRSMFTPYGRFVLPDDPFFKMMALGATIYEQEQINLKKNEKADYATTAWQTFLAGGRVAEEQPLVHGISDYYKKISKGRFGELGGQTLATFVPASSLMRGVSDVFDDKARTGSGWKEEKGKLNYSQTRGFRNSALRGIPYFRNFADESNLVNPKIRGNALIRFGAMFDPFKIKPAQDYRLGEKPYPTPKKTDAPKRKKPAQIGFAATN